MSDFASVLRSRAASAGIPIHDHLVNRLERYTALLAKWNARINLTALTVDPPTPEAVDRLFIEPLAAATHFPEVAGRWVDLGSGAGSPALPIAVVRASSATALTMVEAKSRKAAFLREAVRTLELPSATVFSGRFEEMPVAYMGTVDVVTVRAVEIGEVATAARRLLKPQGMLLTFRQDEHAPELDGFRRRATSNLIRGTTSYLVSYARMFHVEQSR